MVGRLGGSHLRVLEPDQIAQKMIAKDHAKLAVFLLPAVGTISQIRPRGLVQRLSQHAVVGGGPLEADLSGDRKRLIGDRTFRRPEPDRSTSEFTLDELARGFQLMARVAGIAKPAG